MPDAHDAVELDVIAAELYALPPGEFTSARKARAAASAPPLAKLVGDLRKPVVSAWAVDALVRTGGLDEALDLAAALREAQDDLDAGELAQLGRQRRALVSALAAQAVALAADHGVAVSAAAREQVEKTINAAVMDPAAAAAVMTGRLVSPLEAGAFEPADLAAAVGGTLPGIELPAPPDDLAERRARRAAEKAAREAERAANAAGRELAEVAARRDRVRERAAHLRERIDDLRRDLARLESDLASADATLTELDDAHAAAAGASRDADRAAERARSALE
ncbi:transposase [Microbacterium thalassium]|uniref:Uncharacterized protein n=1 Tax=Microbacterium thalassium TaxID=362649 RepID=A0A7X0FPQ3_9MICO|nr:transposase [Microbacterium thalassium]MBB6390925.1 hypothetical protein [Microbacterium thalassium]GLK26033.1 hypothetical protein GCM10017607_33520 [Microbacterium thalassium]